MIDGTLLSAAASAAAAVAGEFASLGEGDCAPPEEGDERSVSPSVCTRLRRDRVRVCANPYARARSRVCVCVCVCTELSARPRGGPRAFFARPSFCVRDETGSAVRDRSYRGTATRSRAVRVEADGQTFEKKLPIKMKKIQRLKTTISVIEIVASRKYTPDE